MPVDGALNAPGLIADVTNTRSRQTIGDDQPRPGNSTAHATFSVVDHFCGSDDSSATPAPRGPRNWGHSAGPAARKTDDRIKQAKRRADGGSLSIPTIVRSRWCGV